MTSRKRLAATLVVTALALFTATRASALPHLGANCRRAAIEVGGKAVPAVLCSPHQHSARRAAVILHGCSGAGSIDERVAARLPAAGIATLWVDYFALTPPARTREYCRSGDSVAAALPTWQRIVVQAAATLRDGSIRARRVAVVGYSLGASLALVAAEYGARPLTGAPAERSPFDAVAAFSAGAFEPVISHARVLPPTLVLSGGDRDIVPVGSSARLYHAIAAAGVHAELYVYPHGDHLWLGRQGAAGLRRVRGFLLRYLRD